MRSQVQNTIVPLGEVGAGHLDRRSSLEYQLENYEPSRPEAVTLDEYRSWGTARQSQFNARRSARIADAIVVGTPQLGELQKELRRARAFSGRAVGRTGVIVSGPAAVGKTTAAFQAMVHALRAHAARYPDWKRLGHIPVVYVEVPSGSTAKAFMGRLLQFLEIFSFERMTLEERTQLVIERLQRGHTSIIVIDEMQNLSRLRHGNFESAQAIKNLLNSVRAVPLYVGMDLVRVLAHDDLGAQFAARSTLVSLEKPSFSSGEGKKLWRGLIRAFETQFALLNHPVGTLLAHDHHLWHRTGGSIGALSRLLTVAALDLIGGDPRAETITIEQLAAIKVDSTSEQIFDKAEKQRVKKNVN